MNINDSKLEELKQLHFDIQMANEFDLEVTIRGNGCNSFEVQNCIKEVFRILEIDEPTYSDQQRIDFLKTNNLDPEDYM